MINIAGLTPVHDPAYRYKMPKLIGKVEGKGNGIKTVLVNVVDLGTALNRDPAEVTKFFGCELGAQTSFTTDRAIVNGAHRDDALQGHLSKYIENFVLCKNCHLPETHYKIKEGLISQKCLACGNKDPVDMRHKLCTFIISGHKKAKEQAKKEAKDEKKDKKDKKDKEKDKDRESKKEKKEKSVDGDSDGGQGSPDKKSSKKSKTKSSDDQQVGSVFTAAEAAAADAASPEEEEEEESESKIVDEAIERYRAYLSAATSATNAEKLEELRNITTMNNLKTAYRVVIYLGAAFNADFISTNAIETHAELLKTMATSEIQQRQVIAAMEWLVGTKYPNALRIVAKAFMQLYDAEVVEEDTFMVWAGDTTVNDYTLDQSMINYDICEAVRTNVAPFVKWLQEAEEEGEEDGDEEEEEDDEEDGEEGGEEEA